MPRLHMCTYKSINNSTPTTRARGLWGGAAAGAVGLPWASARQLRLASECAQRVFVFLSRAQSSIFVIEGAFVETMLYHHSPTGPAIYYFPDVALLVYFCFANEPDRQPPPMLPLLLALLYYPQRGENVPRLRPPHFSGGAGVGCRAAAQGGRYRSTVAMSAQRTRNAAGHS